LKVGDASKVVPVDKLSLLLVAIFATIFPTNVQLEENGWHYHVRGWVF